MTFAAPPQLHEPPSMGHITLQWQQLISATQAPSVLAGWDVHAPSQKSQGAAGSDIGAQIRELRGGVDVAVGTPGRVIDLLERGLLVLDQVGPRLFCQCTWAVNSSVLRPGQLLPAMHAEGWIGRSQGGLHGPDAAAPCSAQWLRLQHV